MKKLRDERDLKITDIEPICLVAPLKSPQSIAGHTFTSKQATLIKVHTDVGLVGIGECLTRFAPEAVKAIVEALKPALIGSDPTDIEALWAKMYSLMRSRGHSKGFMIEAMSGVDVALWDLLGKELGAPVYKLLGGRFRDRIEAYATALMLGEKEELKGQALKFLEEGFKAMKLKIGRGLEEDVERIRAVKEVVGDDAKLMVDANCAYSVPTAIKLGRFLEREEVYWFEEPIPPENLEGYVEISRALDIPVAAGESEFTRYGFRDLISKRAVDIIQPDVCRAGGFSEVRKIVAMASAYDLAYAPHTGVSSAICLAATLHLATSTPDFLIFEYERLPNPLREELLKERVDRFEGGYLEIPRGPGLGVELDERAIQKYSVG
jgi:D-arabinonate dehydratase/D-galactarolactone cycloisomerase